MERLWMKGLHTAIIERNHPSSSYNRLRNNEVNNFCLKLPIVFMYKRCTVIELQFIYEYSKRREEKL